MTPYDQNAAERLYKSLPEFYREKDRHKSLPEDQRHHLYKFFESLGDVLDLTRHTLQQRYRDNFPDLSSDDGECQDWLLPYFADLFAINLASPFADSQRHEISNAVRWTQRKGTMAVIDEITDAMILDDGIVQEGWKRVATTARIGLPLLPATALGEDNNQYPDIGTDLPNDRGVYSAASQHPGMPATTPDFRKHSQAVQTHPSNPAAQSWTAAKDAWSLGAPPDAVSTARTSLSWRQANPNAVPCVPGSYMDVSQRTVDLRDPDASVGHYHAKNLLIFLPPPIGMCSEAIISFTWSDNLDTIISGSGGQKRSDFITETQTQSGWIIYKNKTASRVEIIGNPTFSDGVNRRFERLSFKGWVTFNAGKVEFECCLLNRAVISYTQLSTDLSPAISLKDTVVRFIKAGAALVRLEYVTVMEDSELGVAQATDSIFRGRIKSNSGIRFVGESCFRFSRLHEFNYNQLTEPAKRNGMTTIKPEFYETVFCNEGYGVLNPKTADAICKGAEDGGEMGAFHAWKYCAQLTALEKKLLDYLPTGLRPVVLRDTTLRCPPPKQI